MKIEERIVGYLYEKIKKKIIIGKNFKITFYESFILCLLNKMVMITLTTKTIKVKFIKNTKHTTFEIREI